MELVPNRLLERGNWISLNGAWDFYVSSKSGTRYQINVPYCPESKLSGLEMKGFINECVYERKFVRPKVNKDECVILHFGAVDYEAKVYVNDKYVGKHSGGYTPFSFDITDKLVDGDNVVRVKVYDDIEANVPSGKQCAKLNSFGCFYTRCTGIWQTVWLEIVPQNRVLAIKYFPNIDTVSVDMEISTTDEGDVEIIVLYDGKKVGYCQSKVKCKNTFHIELSEKHLWEVGHGRLYDVIIKYEKDEVKSYFGLREVKFDGMKFLLNGKSVFQRFVLDQGYYPDGVYTPKSDEVIINDIQSALKLGFNGIRLHQKVFDPAYLYYCDKLGCMVWGEFPSWGIKYHDVSALGTFTQEWIETVSRDFNHPSIVMWCPLNETWKNLEDQRKSRDVKFIDAIYALTKVLDATRPCVDVSGGYHGHNTDLYDFHCYESIENLKKYIREISVNDIMEVPLLYGEGENELKYQKGIPISVSEFGGIKFVSGGESENELEVPEINECAVTSTEDWGYGKSCCDEDAFIVRYQELVETIYECEKISGFCYTQLYDIEQEQNGFYKYDRTLKFSEETMKKLADINLQIAAIEK